MRPSAHSGRATTTSSFSLRDYTDLVATSVYDSASRAGFDRAGWIEIGYAQGAIPSPTTREIRFPFYASNLAMPVAAGGQAGLRVALMVAVIFVLCGISYKIAAVPWHMWCPAVYEGECVSHLRHRPMAVLRLA
jgi:hypothetical protein